MVAKLRGSNDDEWVILGNHHDAWVFGAADPGSGTASMLEAARSLGELVRSGWKPRRTILMCEWDAEEPGLIGSTLWVEANRAELQAKAVAYINTDVGVTGPNFQRGGHAFLEGIRARRHAAGGGPCDTSAAYTTHGAVTWCGPVRNRPVRRARIRRTKCWAKRHSARWAPAQISRRFSITPGFPR